MAQVFRSGGWLAAGLAAGALLGGCGGGSTRASAGDLGAARGELAQGRLTDVSIAGVGFSHERPLTEAALWTIRNIACDEIKVGSQGQLVGFRAYLAWPEGFTPPAEMRLASLTLGEGGRVSAWTDATSSESAGPECSLTIIDNGGGQYITCQAWHPGYDSPRLCFMHWTMQGEEGVYYCRCETADQ